VLFFGFFSVFSGLFFVPPPPPPGKFSADALGYEVNNYIQFVSSQLGMKILFLILQHDEKKRKCFGVHNCVANRFKKCGKCSATTSRKT